MQNGVNAKLRIRCAIAAPVFLLAGIGFCSNGWALGIRLLGQDADAMARGDAFVATADNPSAVYYNPAAITGLPGHQFRIGGDARWWDRQQRDTYGPETVSDRDSFQANPEFYYTFSPQQEHRPSVGVGIYSPFGFADAWPSFQPTPLISSGRLSMNGFLDYYVLNPVAAIPLSDTLSVGAGAQLVYSEIKENTDLIDPGATSIYTHNHGSGTGIGYNLGVLWRPTPKHAVGIAYHSSVSVDYKLDQFEGYEMPGEPAVGHSYSSHDTLRFPMNVVGGYSFRPCDKWNLEFDLDWTDWNDARPKNWQSSFIYKWGVTRYFEHDWHLSAGYCYAENTVPESRFSRLTPDSDQHLFSIGAGKRFERCDISMAYRLGYSVPRTIPANLDDGAYLTHGINGAVAGVSTGGRYTAFSHVLELSFGFHF